MNNIIKIQLGDKERGLMFANMAWEEMTKLIPQDERNQFDWLTSSSFAGYACTYGGLVNYDFAHRNVIDYTLPDVINWVDNANSEDIKLVRDKFNELQKFRDMMKGIEDQIRILSGSDEDKKKAEEVQS